MSQAMSPLQLLINLQTMLQEGEKLGIAYARKVEEYHEFCAQDNRPAMDHKRGEIHATVDLLLDKLDQLEALRKKVAKL